MFRFFTSLDVLSESEIFCILNIDFINLFVQTVSHRELVRSLCCVWAKENQSVNYMCG